MPNILTQFWEARNPPADPIHLSFMGKTILITGANSGMGFHAAMKYARLGVSRLILAVRSQEKGEAAKSSILKETNTAAEIVVLDVDLMEFASVESFCRCVKQEIGEVHIVLLCAGVMIPEFILSPDGYELNLQVNVLSTALMAQAFLPKLRESSRPGEPTHLCFLNSMATQELNDEWISDDQSLIECLGDSSRFNHITQYYLIKLAARYFMAGMADACGEDDRVVINCCCPCLCRTNLHQYYGLFMRSLLYPYKLVCGRTAEQGARTLVSATGLGRESHGKLWLNDTLPPPAMFLATERSNDLAYKTFDEIMVILREKTNLESL